MATETPDLMVVGLGPAGSRAATVAAQGGAGVIAIDRRSETDCPVHCAEFVPSMIERDVPGVAAVTQQLVGRMVTYTESGPPEESLEFHGRMIDRAAFDKMLAAEAKAAGVDCRYGVAVTAIDPDGVVHTSNGHRLQPRILIGCDGPRSLVGAAIGQVNRELVDTRQVTVPLILPHDSTEIYLSADYRGGYGWLFPKGAVANVGLGMAMANRRQLKPLLDDLFNRLAMSRRIGTSGYGFTGGASPVGGRLRAAGQIGYVQVMLAGDAAGLTNPVTGAGIAAAVQSGSLAGQAAADWLGGRAKALGGYEEELGDIFDGALSRALRRRRDVLACYQSGGRPDAWALTNGWIGSPSYWAA